MERTLELTGFHHLTAVTANASQNHAFYTQVLGLRLVKKTVNQDDVSAYHLFYADGDATPGTDITFFDWPVAPERRGTRSLVQTGFRVGSQSGLEWWRARFEEKGVKHGEITRRDGLRGHGGPAPEPGGRQRERRVPPLEPEPGPGRAPDSGTGPDPDERA